MRTLYLLRHASALSTDSVGDIDRPLNSIGENEANEMGDRLKAAGIVPDVILSSTAVRATQTGQIVAQHLNHVEGALRQEPKLYNTGEEEYMEVIQNTDKNLQTIMIVGHNPTISNLAVSLSKDFTESLPAGSFLAINFEVDDWKNIGRHSGKRGRFMIPGQGEDGLGV